APHARAPRPPARALQVPDGRSVLPGSADRVRRHGGARGAAADALGDLRSSNDEGPLEAALRTIARARLSLPRAPGQGQPRPWLGSAPPASPRSAWARRARARPPRASLARSRPRPAPTWPSRRPRARL